MQVNRRLRLRELRLERALSQEKLAAMAGIGRVTVTLVETGKSEPMPRTVQKLAQALGVSPIDMWEKVPGASEARP